jgi:hypothetical protein
MALGVGALVVSCGAMGAEWSGEQADLWSFVERSWVDDAGKTGEWPRAYVHDEVREWGVEWPVPRGNDSLEKWVRFRDTRSEVLQYELFPHEIVIVGNTGVVYYSVVQVIRTGDGEAEREVSGLIETLVRSGAEWKYLSLTGFDAAPDDD